MKAKVIKDFKVGERWIRKGEVFEVREIEVPNLFQTNWTYQVIEGDYSGVSIHPHNVIEIEDEKAFTRTQWDDMLFFHKKELDEVLAEKERLKELVSSLTDQLKKKDEEIKDLNFEKGRLTAVIEYVSIHIGQMHKRKA